MGYAMHSLLELRFFSSFLTLRSSQYVMSVNRSVGRDVHIYDANDPTTVLGGLILTNGVTNANFYLMVEVFLLFDGKYVLRHEDGTELQRNDQPMRQGDYFIVTDSRYSVALVPRLLT